jgi:poly-gamma-glutamate capsule biosynthesis protein CapA/YwtB (metallophosphatase superfamily)
MKRRDFIRQAALAPLAAAFAARGHTMPAQADSPSRPGGDVVTLFLAGDVMTGRAIDQVLPHAGDPHIFESYSRSALDYLQLAERASGAIPRPVDFSYIWGDALAVLDAAVPAARIVNLETAVTRRGTPWPRKGIQYRMHPENLPCLTDAGIDCCVLANNHVLDWSYPGLEETLASLAQAGLASAGAGQNLEQAKAPVSLALPGHGRVLVFACGLQSSGIPASWAATATRPGVNLLPDLSVRTVGDIAAAVDARRQAGDLVVISLHWGGNWGYEIPSSHRRFARALIDAAAADVVHGHSSHHPVGIEVYRNRPILYGCGDLIDDYEGISGHAGYRHDLALLYLVTLDLATGELQRLEMVPLQRNRFSLVHASEQDRNWLAQVMDRECRKLRARVAGSANDALLLQWQ